MHLTPFATSRRNLWCRAKSGCGPIVRLTAGPGAGVPAPARTVSGQVSYCRGPVRGEKQQTFYKCRQKCIISIPPRDTKPEFRGHGKVVFHIALKFSDCDEPFVRKSSENGQIRRAVDSRRWPGMTTMSTLRTPVHDGAAARFSATPGVSSTCR